jgi:hypothetical protein
MPSLVPISSLSKKQQRAAKDRVANYASHRLGQVDDCIRCIDCEVAASNAHKRKCDA